MVYVRYIASNRSAPLIPNFTLSMMGCDGSRGLFELSDAWAAVAGALGAQSASGSSVAEGGGVAGSGGTTSGGVGAGTMAGHRVQQFVASLGQSDRGQAAG